MRTVLVAIGLLAISFVHAQSFYTLVINVFQEEYTQLENAENLTADMQGWYFDWFEKELIPAVHYPIMGSDYMELLEIDTDGVVWMEGERLAMVFAPFYSFFIDPAVDPFNTDFGDVYYKFENSTTTIEYRNVASEVELTDDNDALLSRFNLKIEIRHTDGRVRFYYGPSFLSEPFLAAISEDPVISGLALYYSDGGWDEHFSLMLISGDPNDPDFDFFDEEPDLDGYSLTGFPDAGTVYEFFFGGLVNTETAQQQNILSVFPNPAGHQVTLEAQGEDLSEDDLTVKLYDTTGRLHLTIPFQTNTPIDVSELSAGVYYFHVMGSNGRTIVPWVKK